MVARWWPDWRYFCGPNLARLEVFNQEIFFGGPMLARLEVFFWPGFGPVGGILFGGILFGGILFGGIHSGGILSGGILLLARWWPEWRYFCGPNLARLEVFNLEVFLWPECGPIGGIQSGGIFRWPEFGPVGGIFLARIWPGWRYFSVARIWPGWRYFSGPILARLEVFGPVLARLEVFFWRYFSRWPGSGPAVRTFRRYLGEENGAMNREVRLFGSINAIT